jgi:hypothetical protein
VAEGRHNGDYYTPMQAAHILRLTPTRVRQLLQGGELEGARDEAGHWLIPAGAVHERLERLRRESFLEAVGYDPSSVSEMRDLVGVLRSQVEMMRAELDEAHAANRENSRIIAALVQRIPELEAPAGERPPDTPRGGTGGASREEAPQAQEGPPEQRGYAVTPPAEPGSEEPRPSGEEAQEPSEALGGSVAGGSGTARGSWWRRLLKG